MVITDIRITRQSDDDPLRAFVSVVLDDEVVVRGLKIIQGSDGCLFVAMPARRQRDGRFLDIVAPLSRPVRERMEEAILRAYGEGDGPGTAGVPAPLRPPPSERTAGAARELPELSTGTQISPLAGTEISPPW